MESNSHRQENKLDSNSYQIEENTVFQDENKPNSYLEIQQNNSSPYLQVNEKKSNSYQIEENSSETLNSNPYLQIEENSNSYQIEENSQIMKSNSPRQENILDSNSYQIEENCNEKLKGSSNYYDSDNNSSYFELSNNYRSQGKSIEDLANKIYSDSYVQESSLKVQNNIVNKKKFESKEENNQIYKWNDQFQSLMKIEIKSERDKVRKVFLLKKLVNNFLEESITSAKTIINERNLEAFQKTISPSNSGGMAGGEKFIVNGIFFKVEKFCLLILFSTKFQKKKVCRR